MENRKVQRTGYSTLAVSLPRGWVKAVSLKPGDTVTVMEEDDGSLRLFVGHKAKPEGERQCVVNADLCNEPDLLSRILVGNYIVGHERILVMSRRPLKPEHLEEVRSATQRLIGVNVVEQTLNEVTMQSFIDPTKFPVYGLMRRLHIILVTMLDALSRSLMERDPALAQEVVNMEIDADRLYRLIVRQLLLSARDRQLMKSIGVESPLHVAGNRVVAKTLEEAADYLESSAKQLPRLLRGDGMSDRVANKMVEIVSNVKGVAENTIDAFFRRDVKRASRAASTADETGKATEAMMQEILSEVRGQDAAVQLRVVIGSLLQVSRLQKMIAEVAINRALEESSGISYVKSV